MTYCLLHRENSNTLENVYNLNDMGAIDSFKWGTTDVYELLMMCLRILTKFLRASRVNGQLFCQPQRHNALKYTFTEGEMTLPVYKADKNQVEEQLQVSLLPNNMQKLKITRWLSKKAN